MMPSFDFRGAWSPQNRDWPASSYDGRRWTFFSQNLENSPAIFVVKGTHSGCLRTPKMARVEAVLVVADAAVSAKRLAQLVTLTDANEARRIVEQLNAAYDQDHSAFRIERVASGFRLLTKPSFSFWLGKLHQRQAELNVE